jgi:Xaa-Pro aminopeptidase
VSDDADDHAVGNTWDGPAVPPATSDDSPATDDSVLASALADGEAVAVVHVGDRFDDDLRYLTRFAGPDRHYAFVATADERFLLPPALFAGQARREFAGTVVTDDVSAPAGLRAARLLDRTVGGDTRDSDAETGPGTEPTVLVPQQIPHDAAAYLQQAGYSVESTTAVTDARIVKTDAEIGHLRRVQRATRRGIRRAATILAESTVAETDAGGDETEETDSRPLHWQGAPLSTERLRRQVNATLAVEGVRDAGNTVIGAGESCADLHFTGLRPLSAGETILVDVSPRGPAGYYGDCTRTFVVDGDGGWERRAHVAVTAAREAALDELAAGVPARRVQEEAAAEVAAYGFRIDSDEQGFVHSVGHGIGMSLHEGPSFRDDEPLPVGAVVTIEPGVYDPEQGGVRVEDVAVVREDGSDLLGSLPTGLDASEYVSAGD